MQSAIYYIELIKDEFNPHLENQRFTCDSISRGRGKVAGKKIRQMALPYFRELL